VIFKRDDTGTESESSSPRRRLLVIAPNYEWFTNWCRENDINPRSPEVKFVRDPSDFYGYSRAWYKDLGTHSRWYEELYYRLRVFEKVSGFREMSLPMPCGTSYVRRKLSGRVKHRLLYGHVTHKCMTDYFFRTGHDGKHLCGCGFRWLQLGRPGS
jgi:hypothetical protein